MSPMHGSHALERNVRGSDSRFFGATHVGICSAMPVATAASERTRNCVQIGIV